MTPDSNTATDSSTDAESIIERIGQESFNDWYAERQFARNIRRGTPYFNESSSVPPAERHTPSKLLQCHRKLTYQQTNAPREEAPPEGMFWIGRRFENDVIVPYLQSLTKSDEYVRNSMWIDESLTSDGETLRLKGSTDPVIVTSESEPVVVTEVKTKDSLEKMTEPNLHHRAQVHAYMYGLSAAYDRQVEEAVIVYGSRTQMTVVAFTVSFDQEFWERVIAWATEHTEYRQDGVLPPASPEQQWECSVCAFRHRCGESNKGFADIGSIGFLPLVVYPRETVVDYLQAHSEQEMKLTPTLAFAFSELAEEYEVYPWVCSNSEDKHEVVWDAPGIEWDGDVSNPPVCPVCAERGELHTLHGPPPHMQFSQDSIIESPTTTTNLGDGSNNEIEGS